MDRRDLLLPLLLTCTAMVLGCEGVPTLPGVQSTRRSEAEEETYRSKYVTQQDGEALRWLLQHRINTGMTVDQVSEVFGLPGEELYGDAEYKRGGGNYQTSDVGYKWGPDRNGKSLVLYFREGRLVNFNPDEFASHEPNGWD